MPKITLISHILQINMIVGLISTAGNITTTEITYIYYLILLVAIKLMMRF
jgi:hypothetical protein